MTHQKPEEMKKYVLTPVLALLLAGGGALRAQDYPKEYLGMPGDNLNLYAVMNLFQESPTLEAFERSLNDENSRVNNLDLNGDNLIDYIIVSDYVDGDVHNIVLRVALAPNEFQDVAVFTVQRFSDGSVQIQLIGDEALYGKNYIIEPIYEETPNPGYTGRSSGAQRVAVVSATHYEVAAWPVVRYIYHPSYVVWRSSWYWGYWPEYWSPWRPYYWHFYYGYHYNWYPHYYVRYHRWPTYRYLGYHDYYYTRVRVYSPVVIVNITNNVYSSTYSRPELRRSGESFYASVRNDNAVSSSRTTAEVNRSRRAVVPEEARVQAGGEALNQRRASGSSTSNSAVESRRGTVSQAGAADNNATRRVSSASGTTGSSVNGQTGDAVRKSGGNTVNVSNTGTERRTGQSSATDTRKQGNSSTLVVSGSGNTSQRRASSVVQSSSAAQKSGRAAQTGSVNRSSADGKARAQKSTVNSTSSSARRNAVSTNTGSSSSARKSAAASTSTNSSSARRSTVSSTAGTSSSGAVNNSTSKVSSTSGDRRKK